MSSEKKARDLADVITAVLALIPADEQDLRAALGSLRESAAFAPPEGMALLWRRGTEYLVEHLGEQCPTEGWQLEVGRVWSGR